jgi:hypothetical protein
MFIFFADTGLREAGIMSGLRHATVRYNAA